MREETYFTPKEVARRLRLHISTVYRLILSGQLASVRRGEAGRHLVSQANLDDFLVPSRGTLPGSPTTPAPALTQIEGSHATYEEAIEKLREAGWKV